MKRILEIAIFMDLMFLIFIKLNSNNQRVEKILKLFLNQLEIKTSYINYD